MSRPSDQPDPNPIVPESPAPGQPAPPFRMPTDAGGVVELAALAGRQVVLYFYPKDDTSACTEEALSFDAHAADFAAHGAIVIGVSRDSPASHVKFKAKHGFGVVLASDEDASAARAYGVWVEKSMYGRKYMGLERATFLLDAQGVVRKVWRKVKVKGHAEAVLAEVKAHAG